MISTLEYMLNELESLRMGTESLRTLLGSSENNLRSPGFTEYDEILIDHKGYITKLNTQNNITTN